MGIGSQLREANRYPSEPLTHLPPNIGAERTGRDTERAVNAVMYMCTVSRGAPYPRRFRLVMSAPRHQLSPFCTCACVNSGALTCRPATDL